MNAVSSISPLPPSKPQDVLVVGRSPPLRAVEAGLRERDIPVHAVSDVRAADAYCAAAGWRCIYVMELNEPPHTVGHEHAHATSLKDVADWGTIKELYENQTSVVFLLHSGLPRWKDIVEGSLRAHRWDFVRLPSIAESVEWSAREWVTEAVLRVCKLAQASQVRNDEGLFDPKSGRFDASRVAGFLRVPLKELAAALDAKYTTVQKTPAAVALQQGLGPIGRTAELLLKFHRNGDAARQWLNTPHRELDERTPLSVILEGRAEIVTDMLETAYAGIPG